MTIGFCINLHEATRQGGLLASGGPSHHDASMSTPSPLGTRFDVLTWTPWSSRAGPLSPFMAADEPMEDGPRWCRQRGCTILGSDNDFGADQIIFGRFLAARGRRWSPQLRNSGGWSKLSADLIFEIEAQILEGEIPIAQASPKNLPSDKANRTDRRASEQSAPSRVATSKTTSKPSNVGKVHLA